MADTEDYVARARATILAILDSEHAVVHPELQARISEAGHTGSTENIDPHHVTTAIRDLREAGKIEWADGVTRGGRKVTTIQPTHTRLRATRITAAAGRKRLLMARYNGWAQGTKRHPRGLIGPAGEDAVRSAIWASGALQPASPEAGEVKTILGYKLPGSLDSAGYLVPLSADGLPQPPVTVLFEVKNLRSWIYPNSAELFQLLHKALMLQLAHPGHPIVPVFVCRKAHKTTFWMAQQLGFVVIDMGIQFAGDVDEGELLEIRHELHFQDLAQGHGPSLRVRDRLTRTVPRICQDTAAQWADTCSDLQMSVIITRLRRATPRQHEALMAELRDMNASMGRRGSW